MTGEEVRRPVAAVRVGRVDGKLVEQRLEMGRHVGVLVQERLGCLGVTLALGILFWIPTHILTFSIRYHEDYQRAGVPTFASAPEARPGP